MEDLPFDFPFEKTLAAHRPYLAGTQRYSVLLGGAGSGKSVVAAQKALHRALATPGLRQLCVRKVGATLKRSVWALLLDLVSQLPDPLRHDVQVHRSDLSLEFGNGSRILLTGLDDPEKIKSIQGIGSVWVEEATELTEEDFRQLELRVRGELPGYKQFTLTFNPVSRESWLKARFFDAPPDAGVLLSCTTYLDNEFLDDDYRRHMQAIERLGDEYYKVYALGEWGSGRRGTPFYPAFKASRHVCPAGHDPGLTLCLSFDFNKAPYMTCLAFQVGPEPDDPKGRQVRLLAEHLLAPPCNSCADMAALLAGHYLHTHCAGIDLYGDPSGNHRSGNYTRDAEFDLLKSCLLAEGFNDVRLQVDKAPPRHHIRNTFINHVLGLEHERLRLLVHPDCRLTIQDLTEVCQDATGAKEKKRVYDEALQMECEPLGHCSDALDYFVMHRFKKESQMDPRPMPNRVRVWKPRYE